MKKTNVKTLVLAALFLSLALVLPFLTGQIPEIGSMLCPMHIPALLCGFFCGWPWGLAVGFIGLSTLPTKATPYTPGMNWVVIALFCGIPMLAWVVTLLAMGGYSLTGQRMKTIHKVNTARKEAVAQGMSLEEAMETITDETIS